MVRKILKWIFKSEFEKIQNLTLDAEKHVERINALKYKMDAKFESVKRMESTLKGVLEGIDVSVDVHEYNYSPSWAVISLQGQKSDYIKFVDLRDSDIRHISSFLMQFEKSKNIKIDASPQASRFLKINNRRF